MNSELFFKCYNFVIECNHEHRMSHFRKHNKAASKSDLSRTGRGCKWRVHRISHSPHRGRRIYVLAGRCIRAENPFPDSAHCKNRSGHHRYGSIESGQSPKCEPSRRDNKAHCSCIASRKRRGSCAYERDRGRSPANRTNHINSRHKSRRSFRTLVRQLGLYASRCNSRICTKHRRVTAHNRIYVQTSKL